MANTYDYKLSVHFTTSGGNVNSNLLEQEINNDVGIIPTCIGTNRDDDDISIQFDSSLSAGEQTTLTGLINAHTADPEPKITMATDGTNNTTTTIKSSQTGNRTITVPDVDDTLAGISASQTLSNKKLVTSSTDIVDNVDSTKKICFNVSSASASTCLTIRGAQTGNRTIDFPDADVTVVGDTTSQTLSNKKLIDSSVDIIDNVDSTKIINFSVGGASTSTSTTILCAQTGNRTFTIPDATTTAVGTSISQTLLNKTIDADSNTITNIDNADIKAGAAIDATKIAGGTVTNTEFGYIGGLTSDAQTQLNGKAASSHTHATADITSGTFADARIAASNVTQHESLLTLANQIGAPDGDFVGTTGVQTLLNKTIDADSNTITNIDNADIKAGAAIDATKIAGGTVTNTEFGYIGGLTSDAQTQLNGKAASSHTHTASDVIDFNTATDSRITAQKGNANGLATLDSGGKVPASQLNLTNVDYQGTWNASTNTPTITSSSGTQGHYYVVSTAGSTNIDGITDWQAGDWIIFNGSVWEKNDNTDQVSSVAGKQGAVTLEAADITSGTFADARIASSNVTQHEAAITIGNLTGAPTGAVVGISDAQTLTNKTINADSNTITNIDNADIKAGAAIDATKIAGGTVTNTEFGYIGGLTSDAQTQINGKAASSHTHATAEITSGTFADARIASSNVTQHETLLTLANQIGAPDGDFVGTTGVQTLTNKTIDADSNTITNIDNADIKAGAAIDATKIHNGTVTNTEFGYLGSVTSDIQTQLNGKAASSHTHATADITSGTFADARIASSNVTQHESLLTLANQIGAPDGDFVGTTGVQTLTNKTIDADSNTITNIDNADIKAGAAIDATKIAGGTVTNTEFGYIGGLTSDAQTQLNGKAASSHTHATADITSGTFADARIASSNVTQHESLLTLANQIGAPDGDFVGTTGVQTLTNKTIDADSNTITNIDNADIKAGAAIDATKIAGGTVTNTEFGYIGGLTSDAQTQLNGKAASSHTHATADVTSGTFADARIASSNVTQHESLLTLANQIGAPDGDFVGTTGVQTLTNKTIDADSNTITNIDNADIKAGAAIDATKIAGGTVTNTEFGYIGGLTSDAQTQLNGKAASSHTHATADITSGTFADARIAASNVTQHEAAITIGNLTGAPTGAVVGISDAQTLTNKTINADSNTITNIDNADIKAGAAIDATKIAGGTVTNTEFGYIGGLTSDAQTQLNGKAASSHTHATADITSGTFADARIAASNVTQHESLLTITESQVSDLDVVHKTGAEGVSGEKTFHNAVIFAHSTNSDSNVIFDANGRNGAAGASISKVGASGFLHLMPNSEVVQWIAGNPSAASGVNDFYIDVDNAGILRLNTLGGGGAGGDIIATNGASLRPTVTETSDLGTASIKWGNVYGTTIHGDGSNLTGLNATQIADGSVSNAEFQYLNSVTSNVQTQLNGKAASSHTHATTDITSGTFANERIAASNVTQHEAAITIGNLTGAPTGAVVGTTDTQTLTNKTLTNPIINTITTNGSEEILIFNDVGTAVNEFTISNAIAASGPKFETTGNDATISMNFQTKGGGSYDFHPGASSATLLKLYQSPGVAEADVTLSVASAVTVDRTVYFPNASGNIILDTASQTLTNKTINADSNTITNIDNADIKAGAAIDATKIAGGTVTNTEFGYIGGLTSDAQTQLNGKAASSHTHAAGDITSGTFANARIAASNVTQHEAAITIGNLTGAPAGAVVGISDTQTLTNKTMTATSNNVTAKGLHSATTTVSVSSATAPTSGQVLTATSSTAATWQTPGSGDVSGPVSSLDKEVAVFSGTGGKTLTGSGRRDYGASATDPTVPTPQAGDRYYNTAINHEMCYDGTRSKWLSVATFMDGAGRNGTTLAGQYYRRWNGMILAASQGPHVPKGTIVRIGYSTSVAVAHTYEVRVDGTVVTSLASGGAASASSDSVNADFNAGILSSSCATGSLTTTNLQSVIYYKLRA